MGRRAEPGIALDHSRLARHGSRGVAPMALHSRRSALLALGAGVLGAQFAAVRQAAAAPVDNVIARRELKVAVYKDFAPWSFRQDGRLAGVDVELGAMLAKSVGVTADFLELPAGESLDDDLRNAVWRGSLLGSPVADVMLHVPADQALAARNDKTLIGAPYYREQFLLASTNDCSAGPSALNGLRIGVELDSAPDFFLLGVYGGRFSRNVVHYPDGAAAAQAMARGEVAAVLATRAQLQFGLRGYAGTVSYYAGAMPGLGRAAWPVGLAVRADSQDLLARLSGILAEARSDGTLAAMFQKHGLTYTPPSPT